MRRMLSRLLAVARQDRRSISMLRAVLVCGLAQFVLAFGASEAIGKTNKLVGVVFDDSGSMEGRTNTPVFGIQMLAASLTRSDQLYGMTFKQFFAANGRPEIDPALLQNLARMQNYMTKFSLTDVNAQQRTIESLKRWALVPNVNTPFSPVLIMMNFLALSATSDDEVHLFVFTDGGFNDAINVTDLRQKLLLLKQNTKAKNLNVHFLTFVANKADEDAIKLQGVGETFDEAINGRPSSASGAAPAITNVFYVRDFLELRKQMVDIIARISETESEEAQLRSTIVKRSGSKLTVNAPVTVTKLIVISTAADVRDYPQIKTRPPNTPPGSELHAKMEGKDRRDKLSGADGKLWNAKITHLEPYPALPANKEFSIEFDRQLDEQTTILFRTDMSIEWKVFDLNGNEVVPATDGTVTLSAEQDYELRAHIDDKNGGPGPASFQNLPAEAEFNMSRRDASGRTQRTKMQIDKPNDRATAKLRYDRAQSDEISVSVVMPGFVTARSRGIKISVVVNNLDITLTPRPLVSCPNCSASKVAPKLETSAPWIPVMAVTVRAVAREKGKDGKLAFSLAEPLPAGARVQVPLLNVTLEGTKTEFELPIGSANPVELIVEVDGKFLATLPDGHKVKLSAKALAPMVGEGRVVFDIVPRPPDAQLVFAGTTDGAAGDTPLRVKPDGLDGRAGFYVRVLRPYGAPKGEDFRVSIAGLGTTVVQQPAPQDDIVLIKPKSLAWCDCFVVSGRYDIDARFKNAKGQEASLTGAMFIEEVTPWERFLICLWLIIGMFLLAWLLLGVWRLIRSSRFPRGSRILVYPPRKRIEGVPRRLARRPWPWIKPFVFPLSRRLDERCRVEGLNLEAGPGCVRILPKGASAYENIRRGMDSRPISHHFKDGSREPLELSWGERLEELSGERRTFEFLESTSQI
jgi:hypothetical protein